MIGFPIGVLFSNAFEWYAHKYVLHGTLDAERKRRSPYPVAMKAHWLHHGNARKNRVFADPKYLDPYTHEETRAELRALFTLAAATTVLAPVAPWFTAATYYGAWNYWRSHKKAHLEPAWAKSNLPWHYDHHMNKNEDANWCVTRPWFDYVMGTRVISSADLMESNPTGMKLPAFIERPLNRLARKLSPRAFERVDAIANAPASAPAKPSAGAEPRMAAVA